MNKTITPEAIKSYEMHLRQLERGEATVSKYLGALRVFKTWLGGAPVTHQETAKFKDHLLSLGYAPSTINVHISALNGLFNFLGWPECKTSFLKVQRSVFRDESRELNKTDYEKLVSAAQSLHRPRLALLMETICATGIRVSEVKFITVEAARKGCAGVHLKGKLRKVLLPGKLCRKLLKYAGKKKIASGEIFLTGSGKRLSRGQIWSEMKRLCKHAGVKPTKVFPHNLRHLFATVFYASCRDIVRLADILGHSSIDTTRIYLLTSGAEHSRQLEKLGLVS